MSATVHTYTPTDKTINNIDIHARKLNTEIYSSQIILRASGY